jgi:hypothetical protein
MIRGLDPLPASNAPYYAAPDWETEQRWRMGGPQFSGSIPCLLGASCRPDGQNELRESENADD